MRAGAGTANDATAGDRSVVSAATPATAMRHPIEDIVARGHCMGCGFCTLIESGRDGPRVVMTFDEERDYFVPKVEHWSPGTEPGDFICPGTSMDMPALATAVHGGEPEDPILGTTVRLRAGYSTDKALRDKAASGGVTTALLRDLFRRGAIDVAYCLDPGTVPGEARGRLLRSAAEIDRVHGSNYHPARFGEDLVTLVGGTERFAFVGLPCEIAALEMLKQRHPELARRHVVSIGLFCGGINTYRGIAYYLEGFGIDWDSVEQIEYRHGPWPGRIRARLAGGEVKVLPRIRGNTRWKILRYVIAFQGYWMLQRCRMCPDQVADFADIAVGDPHLPRFRARGGDGFSVIVTRTSRGEDIVADAVARGVLAEEGITRAEVVASQSYTLQNRRHVEAYRRVGRFWGMSYPEITVYSALRGKERFQHLVYAWVDLMKIAMPKSRIARACYYPWQIFEYLFLTFTPSLIAKRVLGLIRNR